MPGGQTRIVPGGRRLSPPPRPLPQGKWSGVAGCFLFPAVGEAVSCRPSSTVHLPAACLVLTAVLASSYMTHRPTLRIRDGPGRRAGPPGRRRRRPPAEFARQGACAAGAIGEPLSRGGRPHLVPHCSRGRHAADAGLHTRRSGRASRPPSGRLFQSLSSLRAVSAGPAETPRHGENGRNRRQNTEYSTRRVRLWSPSRWRYYYKDGGYDGRIDGQAKCPASELDGVD